jgi:hypothetical protein
MEPLRPDGGLSLGLLWAPDCDLTCLESLPSFEVMLLVVNESSECRFGWLPWIFDARPSPCSALEASAWAPARA